MIEPSVTIPASSHGAADNLPCNRIVIHSTDPSGTSFPYPSGAGQAAAVARYFAAGADGRGVSAHYVVDVATEEHCVPDGTVAYHAPPNQHSIGIEICGLSSYTRDEWLSPLVWPAVARAAARARELCMRLAVPMRRVSAGELVAGARGLCGHVDVSAAWHQTDHTDPGPAFPWDRFMAAVTGGQPEGETDMPMIIARSLRGPGLWPDLATVVSLDAVNAGSWGGGPAWLSLATDGGSQTCLVRGYVWVEGRGVWLPVWADAAGHANVVDQVHVTAASPNLGQALPTGARALSLSRLSDSGQEVGYSVAFGPRS